MPPRAVIDPVMSPRIHGVPRPVRLPSSDSASAKPMLMPAPIDAARPTAKASHVFFVADLRLQFAFLQLRRALDVARLFLRQIVQQLSDACVLCMRRSPFIEAASLHFHGAHL